MTVLPSPHASAIFCDDVRQENNGKMLYIGVYDVALAFATPPPATVDLKVVVQYVEPQEYSVEPIRMEIVQRSSGRRLVHAEVLPAGPRPAPPIKDDDPEARIALSTVVPLDGLSFEGDDRLRVRWYCGDQLVHGGSLSVVFTAEADVVEEQVDLHREDPADHPVE